MKLTMPGRVSFVSACMAFFTLVVPAFGQSITPLVEALLGKPDAWKTPQLPGAWKDMSSSQGVTRRELAAPEPFFGVPAQRVIATQAAGGLSRLDILFLERGEGTADEAYLQTMRQTAAKASAGVQSQAGRAGQVIKPAAGSPPGTVIQEWKTQAAAIRLTMEPGMRLWISMTALPSTQPAKTAAKPGMPLKDVLKTRVVQRENGDVLITGLPDVDPVEEPGHYTYRVAECLRGYYDWKIDVSTVAKEAGWEADQTMYDESRLFTAIAKEAKARIKQAIELDMLEIHRWIDRGQPVVIIRAFSETRHEFHVEFAKQLLTDPKLELPSAKDTADNSRWLKASEDHYSVACLIVGHNKKRGELILAHPGLRSEDQHIRLREEEMTTSADRVYYLWPD